MKYGYVELDHEIALEILEFILNPIEKAWFFTFLNVYVS